MTQHSRGKFSSIMVLVLTGMPTCVSGEESVETPIAQGKQLAGDEIDELIRQLGDARFSVRQFASAKLFEMGNIARPALLASQSNLDLEIRLQARQILQNIEEQAFLIRLNAFLAGDDPAVAIGFPAWTQFQNLVGGDLTSRRLFVEMQKSEHELLKVYVAGSPNAGDLLWQRCADIQRIRNFQPVYREPLSAGRVAALLLVASDPSIQGRERSVAFLHAFCHQQPVRHALYGEYQQPMREIMGAWIRSADMHSVYYVLRLSMRFNLADGLVPAKQILVDNKPNQRNVLPYALLTIGKLGDAQHISLVEGLLSDKMKCAVHTIGGVNYRTEVRDVALACLFHLAGLDPKEMGFSRMEWHDETLFATRSLGFADDEAREAVLNKWQQLKAEYRLPEQ